LLSLACCASTEPRQVSEARSERALDHARRDLSRAPQGLKQTTHADGTTRVQVQSGFRHATIVTRAADGTRKARCVNDAEEAQRMLLGSAE
jgi:hypothetical protein